MTYATTGFYSFALPAGSWRLFPEAREAAERQLLLRDLPAIRLEPLAEGEEYPTFEFPVVSVAPESLIEVEIIGSDGAPVSGIGVHGLIEVEGHQYDSFGFSDANGIASLPALPGEWELHASTNGLRSAGFTALDTFNVIVVGGLAQTTVVVNRAERVAPILARPRFVDFDTLSVRGLGEPGQRYRIEGSLDAQEWSHLGHVIALDGAFTVEQKIAPGGFRRHFRAEVAD